MKSRFYRIVVGEAAFCVTDQLANLGNMSGQACKVAKLEEQVNIKGSATGYKHEFKGHTPPLTMSMPSAKGGYRDKFYEEYEMLPNELSRKYDEFSKAVQNNDIVDPKTTTMLYLASSMAVGCYP